MIDIEDVKKDALNSTDTVADYIQQQSLFAIAEQLKRIADLMEDSQDASGRFHIHVGQNLITPSCIDE